MGLLWLNRGGGLHHAGDKLPSDEESTTKPTGFVVLCRQAIACGRGLV
jgi:hypothetical protein